jgi:MFS family permease
VIWVNSCGEFAALAIVNVALPAIGRKLRMPESGLQWVVTGYALSFGGSCCSAAAPRTCWGAAASRWSACASMRHPGRGTHQRFPVGTAACGAIGLAAVPVTFLLVRRGELATAVASTARKPPPAPAKV